MATNGAVAAFGPVQAQRAGVTFHTRLPSSTRWGHCQVTAARGHSGDAGRRCI